MHLVTPYRYCHQKGRRIVWGIGGDCAFCRRTSCTESPTDRTETHAVVDSNIQVPYLFAPCTDYVMLHRTDCRSYTTNSDVTVTVIALPPCKLHVDRSHLRQNICPWTDRKSTKIFVDVNKTCLIFICPWTDRKSTKISVRGQTEKAQIQLQQI